MPRNYGDYGSYRQDSERRKNEVLRDFQREEA